MACSRISRYMDGRMRVNGISMMGRVRLGERRRCRTESFVLGPNGTQANFVPFNYFRSSQTTDTKSVCEPFAKMLI
jgi:hypothetical protein